MLTNPKDIITNSSMLIKDVVLTDDYIFACTTTGSDTLRKYNYDLEQIGSNLAILSSAAGITLITAASAVIVSNGSASVDFIDINTFNRRNVTSGAGTVYSGGFGPQVCGNIEAGVAIATRNSNGSLMKITSAQAISSLSPTSLSGAQASCIILKNAASGPLQRWLVGTNNGKVIEIDTSGTEYQTITLPTSPQISAPTQYTVTGMAHWDDYLLVTTSYGIGFTYKYSTSEVVKTDIYSAAAVVNPTNGPIVTSASGLAIIGSSRGTTAGASLTTNFFTLRESVMSNFYSNDIGTTYFTNIRINPTRGKLVATISGTVLVMLRVFDIDCGIVNEPVDLQDPVGVRVPGRVIRLLDGGPGQLTVFSDTSVTAETYPYNIPAWKNQTYIDLALSDSETKWDIREFTK